MSANQTPTYRPAAVTQRDGSPLASSNCRMASIATGLDYDTRGAKKSTGGKMRSYTTDQSGGTDSGDAKQAWYNGYYETLTVRDGNTFDQALEDLRAGRLVHIDVWHATVGGPCLSGGGGYGHTMAILPDCQDSKWLVSDPWCSPAKWARVTESKLRAGAEEWGRRVYGQATGGRPWPGNEAGLIEAMRKVARQLMQRYHAGGLEDDSPDPGDTGGGQRTMYTVTVAQSLEGADVAEGTLFEVTSPAIGMATTTKSIGLIPTQGGGYYNVAALTERHVYAVVVIGSGSYKGSTAYLVQIPGSDDDSALLLASAATYAPFAPPPPVPVTDCTSQVTAAVRERDEAWQQRLMGGQPWPTVETTA